MSDEIKGLQTAQQEYDKKEPVYACSPDTASLLYICNEMWPQLEQVYNEIHDEHWNKDGNLDEAEILLEKLKTNVGGLLLDLRGYRKNV